MSTANTRPQHPSSKRKEPPTPVPVADEGDVMRLTPLGAGQEVGRSCLLMEYKGKTVMLDCGLHPAYSGLAALPFFDNIDPSTIDVLLITHFHVDHAAALPYFMEKVSQQEHLEQWTITIEEEPLFEINYVKISNLSSEDQLYDEQDLLRSYDKIEVVDYRQEVDIEGIRFTPFNAGHVLGAAMFLVEIAGVRVLYTGDYSREEDRHLMAAEKPQNVVPEVLICESTYGVQSHEPRVEREARFTRMVHDVVARGGRCLLPVFALGRAQELLLILDEYWQAHPELHGVPIYYASSLAKKCMTVYQTYTNMMNARIRQQVKVSNPFIFKHISNLKSVGGFEDVGPCVMMASPGMLQNGLSRELLEIWCVDKRNGVIIPGYVVDGTLGKQILSQPDEIISMSGAKLPLRLSVEYISFSAHVDFRENSAFIEEVAAPNVVLVHGDANEMGRLRSALWSRWTEREVGRKIWTPKNCETVELYFRGEKLAKTIGSLASVPPTQGHRLNGVLVCRDFTYRLMAAEDLPEFTDLVPATIEQRLVVPARAPFGLVKWLLEMMYGRVEVIGKRSCRVFDTVTVTQNSDLKTYALEWEGNSINDMVADSVVAILAQAESSPASVKATKGTNHHHHPHDHDKPHDADEKMKAESDEDDGKAKSAEKGKTRIMIAEEDDDEQGEEEDEEEEYGSVDPEDLYRDATEFLWRQFGKAGVEVVDIDSLEEEEESGKGKGKSVEGVDAKGTSIKGEDACDDIAETVEEVTKAGSQDGTLRIVASPVAMDFEDRKVKRFRLRVPKQQ
ncbi:Cleavage and polyadenylation specificity factor subunit 3 [Rhizophlyctis rosea]|uniref:Endoribonuclease YSH1 n=1 Tax=Rhizophlyctis rosea TaxID=64517 RepID=A0AAD5S3M9_9FUNG|nr:Cleavage and polyadenylation specificity factor subunit 3 [Rhizophlyctis rosea]